MIIVILLKECVKIPAKQTLESSEEDKIKGCDCQIVQCDDHIKIKKEYIVNLMDHLGINFFM